MPWCPGCSYEYVQGVSKCPDCGLPLRKAPGLEEAIRFDGRDWVAIRAVTDSVNGELMRGFLGSHGCEVALRDNSGYVRAILGPGTAAGAAIDILVPVESARRAAKLLREEINWSDAELAAYMEEHGELDDDDGDDCALAEEREYLESNNVVRVVKEDEESF